MRVRRGKARFGRSLILSACYRAGFLRGRVTRQDDAGSPGSDGASPSYGVCQATEKCVRSFSFFLEQRSCDFLGLKVQAIESL